MKILTAFIGGFLRLAEQLPVSLLVTSFASDVEQLDLSDILAATAEETEAAQQDVRVDREADSLNTVAAVTPTTAVRVEPVHDGEIFPVTQTR